MLGLIVLVLGAIRKNIFSCRIDFWGEKFYGWHCELMLVLMKLVIVGIDGGRYVLLEYATGSGDR